MSEYRAALGMETTPGTSSNRAVLLSSYGTGANNGKNLGVPGYSHDIVMQLYVPLLEKWGKVIHVQNPKQNLEDAVAAAKSDGLDPIHLSVIPCQDAYLSPSVPNVLMPAWEFPDIPNQGFAGNPNNDWTKVAGDCDALIVSGPFTKNAFRKAGTNVPIHYVQVPTPESYFDIPDWNPGQSATIACGGYAFPKLPEEVENASPLPLPQPKQPAQGLKKVGKQLESAIRLAARNSLGEKHYRSVKKRIRRIQRNRTSLPPVDFEQLDLSGVVFTSIFNPNDGRKNWTDLLTAFLTALGDKEDATLVIKLVTRNPLAISKVLGYYRGRDIPHRCKLKIVTEYLTDQQLCELAAASTYYIQTTKAEGNCLPLMNYLAAGRPGISPCHSAISDYFDNEIGLIADSHQEPAAWPHDPRLRIRSTWARLVWPSMVEQIRESYRIAKDERETYCRLSQNARAKLDSWAGMESVQQRLLDALDQVWFAGKMDARPMMIKSAA
jgi:hypothetical protein